MPITSTVKTGKSIEPISAGSHHAVCYGVVDVGTHPSYIPEYEPSREVIFLFELPNERGEFPSRENPDIRTNQPRGITAKFKNYMSKTSKLRKMLVSWRGKEFTEDEIGKFDLSSVIGANAMLSIAHAEGKGKNVGKTFANVTGVMGLPKGMNKAQPENPRTYFSFQDQKPGSVIIPENLPKWIADLILSADEYKQFMESTPPIPASNVTRIMNNAASTRPTPPPNGQAFDTSGAEDSDCPF
jgi:hypothetical protein